MNSTKHWSSALSYGRRMMLVFAGVVLLFGSPGYALAAGTAASGSSDSEAALKTIVIPIEGMECVACAATVKHTVKSLAGVSRVEVSLEKRTAQVTYAPDKLSLDRIVAAIDKLGYKAGIPRDAE